MKKTTFTILIFLMTIAAYCQTKENKFNFDFEQIENGIPIGWAPSNNQNYTVSLDSINVKKGKYSVLIEYNDGIKDYQSIDFKIPDSYDGKKITLSGYIKTENVTDGYAGFWMSINPNIAFDKMYGKGIKGTSDWKKLEITLDLQPKNTKEIEFGGTLIGKGKMWIDDLQISIDGVGIEKLMPLEKVILPAESDKEFDNGSQITNINLNSTTIENLKTLGLIWGFLKYYHPNIAKGEFNWDYELFRVLPKVLNVKNNKERDVVLVAWITQLGQFEQATEIKSDSVEIKMKPDLDWISNSNFSNELKAILLNVKKGKRTISHFYVKLWQGGYPSFTNENPYASMKNPDAGFRILALYRYWNIVQYYFPYKNLIEEDWKNVLEEFIPKINNSITETEYTLTLLELIVRINDTHANVWGSNKIIKDYLGINYAAPGIKFIEDKAVITYFHDEKFGKETELEIGDVISKVNNKSVESIIKSNLKLTSASNYPTKLREIAANLLRTNDSLINIEFIRNKVLYNKTLKTYSTKEINVWSLISVSDTCFKFVANDIAYINNGSLKPANLPELWKQIQNTKGLIIDNRNYPSHDTFGLLNYLYSEKKPFVKFTGGNYFTPGLFTFQTFYDEGKENKDFYKGKVVILVNEITQSTSEFCAMAYRQSPNAIVIGSTTAGADGSMTGFYLPGNIKTAFTGVGVYYPDGRETQRIGIVPDIEVKPTIEGIKNGRDELIEKAIEVINNH